MPDGGYFAITRVNHAEAFSTWARPAASNLFAQTPAPDPNAANRHPWLAMFQRAPDTEFANLITGHAAITPLARLDAPQAAQALFGCLSPIDPARVSLGWAVLAWLEQRRRDTMPADPAMAQRWLREVRDALNIIAILDAREPALALRRGFASWNAWVADMAHVPSRDVRAAYWLMLAQTQPLIRAAEPAINPFGLAAHWLWVCENAGGTLPDHYLGIGLLGLRRLPETDQGSEIPWMTGLAVWADARHPTEGAFKAQWLALKSLYPRTPARWQAVIAATLTEPRFQAKGLVAPAWWAIDPDLR